MTKGLISHVFVDPNIQPVIVGYYENTQNVFFTEQEKREVAVATNPEAKAAEIFDTKYKSMSPNP